MLYEAALTLLLRSVPVPMNGDVTWGLTLLNRVNWEWQAAWVWDSGAEWGWDQYQGGAAYTHAHGYRALATARTAASPGNSHCSVR